MKHVDSLKFSWRKYFIFFVVPDVFIGAIDFIKLLEFNN